MTPFRTGGKRAYLIECDSETQEQKLLTELQSAGIRHSWVAVDPNPEVDGRGRFGDARIFKTVQKDVAEILRECADMEKWPAKPADEWTTSERRELVHLAVTRWNHLAAGGCETADVLRDLYLGMITLTAPPVGIDQLDRRLVEDMQEAADAHLNQEANNPWDVTDETRRLMRRDVKAVIRRWQENGDSETRQHDSNWANAVARAMTGEQAAPPAS